MSDQELQLLEKVRIHMGLGTIEQTVEALAKSALAGHSQDGDCQCSPAIGPGGQQS